MVRMFELLVVDLDPKALGMAPQVGIYGWNF
jgi:hypothetical protein